MSPTIRVLSRERAAAAGFATFNRCDHVCIDLPPGMTSVSLRSADGKLISMCLLPTGKDEARAECLDIGFENAPVPKVPGPNRDGTQLNRLHVLGFTPGPACIEIDRRRNTTPITLLTILLSDQHYGKRDPNCGTAAEDGQ